MRLSKNSKRNVKNGQSHRINNSSGITCFYSQMFFLILNNILFFGFFYKHLKECRNKKTPMKSKTPTTLFFSWFRGDLYLIVSLAYQGGNSHEIKNIWLYFGRHYRKCNSIENMKLRRKFYFTIFLQDFENQNSAKKAAFEMLFATKISEKKISFMTPVNGRNAFVWNIYHI